MYSDIFLLTLIIVFIVDLSGAIDTLKHWIWDFAFKGKNKPFKDFDIKPISCSLCCSFWAGIAYLLVTGALGITNLAYVSLMAFMTPLFKDVLLFIKDFLFKVIDGLYSYFNL